MKSKLPKIINHLTVLTILVLTGSCVPNSLSNYLSSEEYKTKPKPAVKIPAVYPVDENTYRIREPLKVVWDEMIGVLSQDYGFEKVQAPAARLLTNWDRFTYLDLSCQNQIEVRIKKISPKMSELKIINRVESFGAEGASPRTTDRRTISSAEIGRIVNNLAYRLGAEKPKLPANIQVAMKKMSLQESL